MARFTGLYRRERRSGPRRRVVAMRCSSSASSSGLQEAKSFRAQDLHQAVPHHRLGLVLSGPGELRRQRHQAGHATNASALCVRWRRRNR